MGPGGSGGQPARQRFRDALLALHHKAANPSAQDLAHASGRVQIRRPAGDFVRAKPLKYTTVQDWLDGKTLPRQESGLRQLLATYALLLKLPEAPDGQQVLTLWKNAKAAGPPPEATAADPWLDLAERSPLWKHTNAPADEVERMRARTVDLAGRLAGLRVDAESTLREDPWTDPTLAARIADRTNLLLQQYLSHDGAHRERPADERFDPSPAEAALLVVLPLLHHLHRVRRAAGLAGVRPADLTTGGAATATPERLDYEAFLYGQDTLVRRADLSRLDDIEHPDGTREIGWWLLHRWIDSGKAPVGRDEVREMLEAADVPDGPLREALAPDSVERLLSSPRRPPYELAGLEQRSSHLHDYGPWVRPATGPAQPVREHLLGCLFALVQAMALEVTDLPDILVKHIGVRDPVVVEDFNRTLERAQWQPLDGGDGIVLTAECGHPAAVAALRAHVEPVDELLRVLRRRSATSTLLRPLTHLPVYASADAVREVDGEGRRVPASALARFRLDEDRVRDLLTGERLYGDRSLAIRELYQNALDACRYLTARRQATAQQRHETNGYRGLIGFRQGVDEDGRPYLECEDNGIGMGEAELTGVFSQAGARFVGQSTFRDEATAWGRLDPPVRLHPNSRFGIGVLSYFMLAEEVRVTTRRDGSQQTLTAFITGPGNFFRIRPATDPRTTPGTVVRLYLRDDGTIPSCVDVLNRLLAIAEFETTAAHAGRTAEWSPGELRERNPDYNDEGFSAFDAFYHWTAGDDGKDGQVVAVHGGGALLVDGLLVTPGKEFARLGLDKDDTLKGLVVNLTGQSSPAQLSVDRLKVQGESTTTTARDLVLRAARAMADGEDPGLRESWLSTLASSSLPLADLFTTEAIAADLPMATHPDGTRSNAGRCGYFWRETDGGDFLRSLRTAYRDRPGSAGHTLPDHVVLWRLAARPMDSGLGALADIFPALRAPFDVLAALPSDVVYFTMGATAPSEYDYTYTLEQVWRDNVQLTVADVVQSAHTRRADLRDTLARAVALGLSVPAVSLPEPEPSDAALLVAATQVREMDFDGETLDVTDLVQLHSQLGVDAVSAAHRLSQYGFRVPDPVTLPERPHDYPLVLWNAGDVVEAQSLIRLSESAARPVREVMDVLRRQGVRTELDVFLGLSDLPEGSAWSDGPVPPGFALAVSSALNLDIPDVLARIEETGGTPPQLPDLIVPQDLDLLSRDPSAQGKWWRSGARGALGHVLLCAKLTGLTPAAVRERAHAYGLECAPLPPDAGSAEGIDDELKLLSRDGNRYGPWLDERLPVPAAVAVIAAARLDITPERARDRLHRLGLAVPPAGEGTAEHAGDATLFAEIGEARYTHAYPSAPISIRDLRQVSRTTSQHCAAVAARLVSYGLELAAEPPDPHPRDVAILRQFPERFSQPDEEQAPVTRLTLLRGALELGLDTAFVADRLRAHGLTVPDGPFPEELVDSDRAVLNLEEDLLPEGWTVPLIHLLLAARETNRPAAQVYERCVALGLPVPTDETVATALARVPRAPSNPPVA
ncbi:wHTH domain-containing protein [Streptomyces cyaneofuscatus]|uniref:wHTH domain-containing protein n=1 Tax=Streptomyces cyaneofuscatus TaxID=66883 RepID=UPI0036C4FDC4